MSLRLTTFVAFCLCLLACGGPAVGGARAAACDLVAAPSGADRAAGTVDAPLRTPQHLIDRLEPGQTGCLRGGTYNRSRYGYIARFAHGGRRGAPLTLRSYPGERAKLAGIVYVTKTADWVTISDLDVDDTTRSKQLTVQINASHTTLRRARVTNYRRQTCVILGAAGAGTAKHTTIADSQLRDCGDARKGPYDHAIYAAKSRYLRVTGNIITGASAYAVHLYPDTQHAVVTGNLLADNGGGVIFGGEGRKASSRNLVARNIITGSGRLEDISSFWGGRVGVGNIARDNCTSGPTPDDGPGISILRNVTASVDVTAAGVLRDVGRCKGIVGDSVAKTAATLR